MPALIPAGEIRSSAVRNHALPRHDLHFGILPRQFGDGRMVRRQPPPVRQAGFCENKRAGADRSDQFRSQARPSQKLQQRGRQRFFAARPARREQG